MKPTTAKRRTVNKPARAFRLGVRAWHDGTQNPYKDFSKESKSWFRGFEASGTIEPYDKWGTQRRFILSQEGDDDE